MNYLSISGITPTRLKPLLYHKLETGTRSFYFGPPSTTTLLAKAGMVHSVSGCTRGVQIKLRDQSRMRTIPERLRGVSRQGAIQIHVYLYLHL